MNKALVILFLFSHCSFFASGHQTTLSMPILDFISSILHCKGSNTEWTTKVNTILPRENASISIELYKNFDWCYYGNNNTHFPPIIINKRDVLNLGFEKMHILKDIQRTDCFSHKELS